MIDMPRATNLETKIFEYFQTRPPDQARLVFRVVKEIMRKREKTLSMAEAARVSHAQVQSQANNG